MTTKTRVPVFKKVTNFIQRFYTILLAIAGIIGIAVTSVGFVTRQIHTTMDNSTADIRQAVSDNAISIRRVELIQLINDYPDDIIVIEKMMKEYVDMHGNHYLMSIYEQWGRQYDPDHYLDALKD